MKGYEVRFGTRVVIFYPLSLTQLRDMADEIVALRGVQNQSAGDIVNNRAQFDSMLKLFTAAARRGEPSVTDEDVGAVVDMANIHDISAAVLGRKVRQMTGDEVDASAPMSPQSGGESSQALRPAPVGATQSSAS